MRGNPLVLTVCWLAATALPPVTAADLQHTASGSKGLVVSGRVAATAAGIRMLDEGGNAADAGAATLLALSVTQVGAFCIGGEVAMLIYDADKKDVKVLSGQGAAPLDPKAIDWYMTNGIPGSDVRSAAVPAALDLIVTLLKSYGTRSFEDAVQPTLAILDAGGPTWYIDTSDGRRIETGPSTKREEAGMTGFRRLRIASTEATSRMRWNASTSRREDSSAKPIWAHKTRVEDPVHTGYR